MPENPETYPAFIEADKKDQADKKNLPVIDVKRLYHLRIPESICKFQVICFEFICWLQAVSKKELPFTRQFLWYKINLF